MDTESVMIVTVSPVHSFYDVSWQKSTPLLSFSVTW